MAPATAGDSDTSAQLPPSVTYAARIGEDPGGVRERTTTHNVSAREGPSLKISVASV
jgi:hypothetical protein